MKTKLMMTAAGVMGSALLISFGADAHSRQRVVRPAAHVEQQISVCDEAYQMQIDRSEFRDLVFHKAIRRTHGNRHRARRIVARQMRRYDADLAMLQDECRIERRSYFQERHETVYEPVAYTVPVEPVQYRSVPSRRVNSASVDYVQDGSNYQVRYGVYLEF